MPERIHNSCLFFRRTLSHSPAIFFFICVLLSQPALFLYLCNIRSMDIQPRLLFHILLYLLVSDTLLRFVAADIGIWLHCHLNFGCIFFEGKFNNRLNAITPFSQNVFIITCLLHSIQYFKSAIPKQFFSTDYKLTVM